MFRKVLIANRGEIAVRIMRTLRDLQIGSVAVYSEADRGSLHAEVADEAYLLGLAPASESYLNIPAILDSARRSGAEAVHPGYGFLAENSGFAKAVEDAGLIWIGPPPAAMEIMGDKVSARAAAVATGVPIVAGTNEATDADGARQFATEHGYPIAVKAVMGGGGKAFRVVRSGDELDEAIQGAAREAQAYFADSSLFVERYVDHPRHVEAQILADPHGNVAFCGERDCSSQRRHQKLVEEAPCIAVTPQIRMQIAEAAISLAKSVGYRSAGTVEMLLSPEGELSFLEMNTRLQVEHPVTELVGGVDLVAEQIRLAAGDELGYEELTPRGHAIECRINAEDPSQNFLPSPGYIESWTNPEGPWVRVDAGFGSGREIPRDYDSLIAKLVVHGNTRELARTRMLAALDDLRISGVQTTVDFHRAYIRDEAFTSGEIWTRYVEDEFLPNLPEKLAALPELPPIRAASPPTSAERSFKVEVSGRRYDVSVTTSPGPPKFRPLQRVSSSAHHDGAHTEIRAPMQGTILKVVASTGNEVSAGELICTLEAMKMENHILAPRDGSLTELHVEAGDTVETGALIAVIE